MKARLKLPVVSHGSWSLKRVAGFLATLNEIKGNDVSMES